MSAYDMPSQARSIGVTRCSGGRLVDGGKHGGVLFLTIKRLQRIWSWIESRFRVCSEIDQTRGRCGRAGDDGTRGPIFPTHKHFVLHPGRHFAHRRRPRRPDDAVASPSRRGRADRSRDRQPRFVVHRALARRLPSISVACSQNTIRLHWFTSRALGTRNPSAPRNAHASATSCERGYSCCLLK